MTVMDQARQIEADRLYERYGQSFEETHKGQFIAISPRGEILLGTTVSEVLRDASVAFGPGNYVFKLGERAVGKLR